MLVLHVCWQIFHVCSISIVIYSTWTSGQGDFWQALPLASCFGNTEKWNIKNDFVQAISLYRPYRKTREKQWGRHVNVIMTLKCRKYIFIIESSFAWCENNGKAKCFQNLISRAVWSWNRKLVPSSTETPQAFRVIKPRRVLTFGKVEQQNRKD